MMIGRYENNGHTQVGFGRLIVKFAKMGYEQGKPLIDATLEGAKLRLRPILMTSFAFILGCVPLAKANVRGANSIGWTAPP